MKTGFVIIHYNDYESLNSLIKNVSHYKIIDRVIVVDNNSRDEVKSQLNQLASAKVKVIINKENKGFAAAINIGCKSLIDEFGECNFIISNCDIVIDKEEDIKELLVQLDNKKVGVVAPTILENGHLNRGWKEVSPFLDSLMNLVYIHRFIRKKFVWYPEEHYDKKTSMVDVVSGCFFCIKSSVLKQIHYFDENTFLYYEENILAKKIKQNDLNLVVCNDINIVHNHSVSIDKNINQIKKLKLQKKSQYYFHTRYNEANVIEKVLLKSTAFFSRMILTIVYFIKDLIKNS